MTEDAVRVAEQLSAEILRVNAARVDAEQQFPSESISALRGAGFLAYLTEERLMSGSATWTEFAQLASALGGGCLSSALVFVMHNQQVATLTRFAAESLQPVVDSIVRDGPLVASVTTETQKGGDLMSAHAALSAHDGGFRLRRFAPVVSYGTEADYFLITMRAGADKPPTDVRFVLVRRSDGLVAARGGWDAMGMRGTASIPIEFDVVVSSDQVLVGSPREIALSRFVPAAHIGWSAAWYGAARSAFDAVVALLRAEGRSGRRDLNSTELRAELAAIRVKLDCVRALLERIASRLDRLVASDAPIDDFATVEHLLELNGLKIAASDTCYAAVNRVVDVIGMKAGYLHGNELRLEQIVRDLRSASLMFSNDRLRQINGALVLANALSTST